MARARPERSLGTAVVDVVEVDDPVPLPAVVVGRLPDVVVVADGAVLQPASTLPANAPPQRERKSRRRIAEW